MTKGIVIAIALAATGLPNVNFKMIEKDENGAVAISDYVQETKDVRSIWILIYHEQLTKDGMQALLGPIKFNCTLSQAQYGTATRLGPKAEVLGETPPLNPNWQAVQPNSATADLFERVCGHEANRSMEAQT